MTSKTEATLEDMGKSSTLPSKGKKRLMSGISHKIPKEELKPGDHIYTWRVGYSYTHHGICVADDKVIHFTACGKQSGSNGLISSSLDCFLSGGKLYRFRYNTSLGVFLAKARGGTSTCATSDPPEDVIHRAEFLLKYGFGVYHVLTNNCEDFALYCKTGILVPNAGRSGQASAVATFPFKMAAFIMTPLYVTAPAVVLAMHLAYASFWACSSHTFIRYFTDIGNREGTIKIPVEQLVFLLD